MKAAESGAAGPTTAFEAFAAELDLAFGRSAGVAQRLEIDLCGAGVTIEFDSPALAAALRPALARLPAPEPGRRALRVRAFAGGAPAAPPWPLEPPPGGEATLRLGSGRFVIAGAPPSTLTVADLERDRAWFWAADVERLSIAERAAPFLRLFSAALARRQLWVVHGGAVADGRRALLVVGRSGSGKSTSCLAALAAGLSVLGDDYVIVRAAPAPPTAYPLDATAKADDAARARLARAGVALPARGREPAGKTLLDLGGDEVRWAGATPLCAIVLPRVAPATGEPVPISPAVALRALAPSSLFQLGADAPERFAACVALSRALPAFRLDVGPELRTVAAALAGLLGRRPSEVPA